MAKKCMFVRQTGCSCCSTIQGEGGHSASVALRTCSPEHFNKHPRTEIQNEVLVGDSATTTPGPVKPLLWVYRLLRHTMAVSPALTSSFGWDL